MTEEANTSYDFQIVWWTDQDQPTTVVPTFEMPIDHINLALYNILDDIKVKVNFLPSEIPITASGFNLNWDGNFTRLGGISSSGTGGVSDEPELLFVPFKPYCIKQKEGIDGHYIKSREPVLRFWWTYDNYDQIILDKNNDKDFKIILSFTIHG